MLHFECFLQIFLESTNYLFRYLTCSLYVLLSTILFLSLFHSFPNHLSLFSYLWFSSPYFFKFVKCRHSMLDSQQNVAMKSADSRTNCLNPDCSSTTKATQVVLVVKNPPASAGDIRDKSSIPGSERSPGAGHGNPLQYSCLENPMDRWVGCSLMGSQLSINTPLKKC